MMNNDGVDTNGGSSIYGSDGIAVYSLGAVVTIMVLVVVMVVTAI